MENSPKYWCPDSGNSSPGSREIGCDNINASSWDGPLLTKYRVKFLCSYGGKIQPRPHDNQLAYVGGDTKILTVDRTIKFAAMLSKLSSLCDSPFEQQLYFKYQLPGVGLDALISVTNDEDLEHMMSEYDSFAKPVRLRIFLFNGYPKPNLDNLGETKLDGQWFVDIRNSIQQLRSLDLSSPLQPANSESPANPHFLLGFDKGPSYKLSDPHPNFENSVDLVGKPMVSIQGQMENFQIGESRSDKVNNEANPVHWVYQTEYYMLQEKLPQPSTALPVSIPTTYSPERHMEAGRLLSEQTPVYVLPVAATGLYHQNPPLRPATGPPGQSYYSLPHIVPEVYQEHPVYNLIPPPQSMIQQHKVTALQEGVGVVQQPPALVAEQGFSHVGYDSFGIPVYYTMPGGLASPYQVAAAAVAPASDGRPTGASSQDSSKPV
ncbi:hypothetical protein Nepgr_005082 [Nepenthes gracilis]|uniref:PB1 domain-containing protein n=1 Tax=Nepenthes gracilis TaxID=150966 RepID=A0AAD3S2H9_NEPGR|nr:hypothetical protein Nepgr_005082 [Nepenthes gracilis]